MKIYISGPISGRKGYLKRFAKAEKELMVYWDVINPCNVHSYKTKTWEAFMRTDIKFLMSCDHVYMLRGWRNSRGARLEHRIAKALKIKIGYE